MSQRCDFLSRENVPYLHCCVQFNSIIFDREIRFREAILSFVILVYGERKVKVDLPSMLTKKKDHLNGAILI